MAKKYSRQEMWWRAQGYSNEPGKQPKYDDITSRLREDDEPVRPEEIPFSYYPSRTSNPTDPRTSALGYDKESRTMVVAWGDGGTPYYYRDVSPSEWRAMRLSASPGRLINDLFNTKEYGPFGE